MFVYCVECGKRVSTVVDKNFILRAVAICPECLQKETTSEVKSRLEIARLRARVAELETPEAAAAIMGKAGGKVTSDAKTAAARANGKKGGYPKGKRRKVFPPIIKGMK